MKLVFDDEVCNSTKLVIEEYIPMKIVLDETEEPINYFSYSKEKKSLLEIAVGVQSGKIKKVTLLMSEDYTIYDKKICMANVLCESANIKVKDYITIECEKFSTELFEDALRISLSDKNIKRYVKMDRLYIGLSNEDDIIEICIIELSDEERKHIKNELEYQ